MRWQQYDAIPHSLVSARKKTPWAGGATVANAASCSVLLACDEKGSVIIFVQYPGLVALLFFQHDILIVRSPCKPCCQDGHYFMR